MRSCLFPSPWCRLDYDHLDTTLYLKLDYVFHHRALPAVYAQYQQPTAAYVAHNGMLIPAQSAQPQTPLIDYTGAYVTQLAGGAFAATDVAAAAGTG